MLRPRLYQLASFHFFLLHLLLSFDPTTLVTATPQQHHHNPAPHDITPAQRACAELQTQLGASRIQTPSSPNPEYRNVATGAWNRFNALSEPSCVALPLSSADVQVVMKSIFKYSVKYAVQAGGHSAGAGWGSVDGGIVISFMNMRSVSYDPVRDVVTLQPGIRWGEALQELEPFGVAVLGGRLGNIGTGLLLGGGLSYLSNAHGFSVDALEEADVVLVSGEMVTATATNRYSDLFKALKGGANRFGIYDNSTSEALLKATADFINNVNDPKASLLSGFSTSFTNTTVTPINFITFFYAGTSPPPSIFAAFLALPNLGSSVGLHSYMEATASLGTGREGGGQGQIFGASAFASVEYERGLGGRGRGGGVEDPAKDGVEFAILAFTAVMKSQVAVGRARGGNAIDAPLTNYALVQFHNQMPPGWDAVPRRVSEARREILRKMVPTPGIPLYVNECDREQNVFSTYGGYEFLKRTYRKYDPTRFNVRYTDGPEGL
ncbi:hypothetical protein DFP72DRAFT_827819 [Ephemerocybe angulata]|uniref:FAD-binding PCMH-type domain-containing protein n=1 Tax=Ephemerocybe angulata TaxID=980116 RepID=A0A8H6HCW6_9AGAR|nr:hypothetical protein DFP72DRAFT_827819 [Tulosesus angulatus]